MWTQQIKFMYRPQLPAPPNQLTTHNIEVSPFVKMGKNQQNRKCHITCPIIKIVKKERNILKFCS
jgi:hypothetical protein